MQAADSPKITACDLPPPRTPLLACGTPRTPSPAATSWQLLTIFLSSRAIPGRPLAQSPRSLPRYHRKTPSPSPIQIPSDLAPALSASVRMAACSKPPPCSLAPSCKGDPPTCGSIGPSSNAASPKAPGAHPHCWSKARLRSLVAGPPGARPARRSLRKRIAQGCAFPADQFSGNIAIFRKDLQELQGTACAILDIGCFERRASA
jgi:hypothetical protein